MAVYIFYLDRPMLVVSRQVSFRNLNFAPVKTLVSRKLEKSFFFCVGRNSNLEPCIYYALFIPTELSSRWQLKNSLQMKQRRKLNLSRHKYTIPNIEDFISLL